MNKVIKKYWVSFSASGPEISNPEQIIELTRTAIQNTFPAWVAVDDFNVQLLEISEFAYNPNTGGVE